MRSKSLTSRCQSFPSKSGPVALDVVDRGIVTDADRVFGAHAAKDRPEPVSVMDGGRPSFVSGYLIGPRCSSVNSAQAGGAADGAFQHRQVLARTAPSVSDPTAAGQIGWLSRAMVVLNLWRPPGLPPGWPVGRPTITRRSDRGM